jgi:hypothetical protein
MIRLIVDGYCENCPEFCANSDDIDELSFRQMVDNHYQETYYCHDYLKAGHKNCGGI